MSQKVYVLEKQLTTNIYCFSGNHCPTFNILLREVTGMAPVMQKWLIR